MMSNLQPHQVLETHIDVGSQEFVATVGIWPECAEGDPWEKVRVVFHIPQWLPEYGTLIEEFLASSPEWGGVGPERPSPNHVWAPIARQWHLTPKALQQAKDDKWLEVKASRARADWSGFTWGGVVFDSGTTSQQRISEFASRASRDPDFVIEWVLADNTTRVLNAVDMVAVDRALGDYVAAHAARAQALRAVIEASSDVDEINSITFEG